MEATINVPATTKAYYSATVAPQVKRVMVKFAAANAGLLAQVEAMTKVPSYLTTAFAYIESECGVLDVRPRSARGAVGLMQIDSETATDTILREASRGRLSDDEKAFLRQHLGGTLLDRILRTKPQSGAIPQSILIKAPVNLYLATLYLGQLLDAHTEDGAARLDKVVVRYNRGVNTKPVGATATEVMAWARKKWPGRKGTITSDYIAKLVGRNGLVEMLTVTA